MHDREYTWSDLTTNSENELLKNEVCFEGSTVPLIELISVESQVTKFLPLADLLVKRTQETGRPLLSSTTDGCIENYYIPRTVNQQVTIKKDIFEQKFSDHLLETTKKIFRKCCEVNSERNVHCLLEDKSGRLICQESQGSLRVLRQYIDTQKFNFLPPIELR